MKAVLLAGGYATRLRPLTITRPKPLLPVLGKPLIYWLVELLSRAGVREVVVSVRYMSQQIREALGNGVGMGVSVTYVEENSPLGDAGPLRLVDEVVGLDSTFLVVYGDVFTDVDVARVVELHRRSGAIATLTAVPVENPERYGILEVGEDGRVVSFVEKPTYRPRSNLANAGVYVFEPEVLKYVERGRRQKIAVDLIPRILRAGPVYAYVHRGLWFDIGVPDDYLRANIAALRTYYPGGYVSRSAEVLGEVEDPVYVGDGAVVEEGSVLGPYTVILDGVRVGRGSLVRGSLVMRRTHIGYSTYIRDSIIGEECSIGSWVRIESGTVIGDQVSIADEVLISRRNYILPYKEISDSIWKEGEVVL
jgi:mannose-1-phosphate guanylyltransferase